MFYIIAFTLQPSLTVKPLSTTTYKQRARSFLAGVCMGYDSNPSTTISLGLIDQLL